MGLNEHRDGVAPDPDQLVAELVRAIRAGQAQGNSPLTRPAGRRI